ncbi:MAG: hypothetical protein HRU03_04500 [Nanoarchaeales archaeon]|nr:hypothetical protein [Nanoarchaeales archaeon]
MLKEFLHYIFNKSYFLKKDILNIIDEIDKIKNLVVSVKTNPNNNNSNKLSFHIISNYTEIKDYSIKLSESNLDYPKILNEFNLISKDEAFQDLNKLIIIDNETLDRIFNSINDYKTFLLKNIDTYEENYILNA